VRVVVFISADSDQWLTKQEQRTGMSRGEVVRGVLRLGAARVESGAPIPPDTP
jgi:hypothetical protein